MPLHHFIKKGETSERILSTFRKQVVASKLAFDHQHRVNTARRPENETQRKKRYVRQAKYRERLDLGSKAAEFVLWRQKMQLFEIEKQKKSTCSVCGAHIPLDSDSDAQKFVTGTNGWAHTKCAEHYEKYGTSEPEKVVYQRLAEQKEIQVAEAAKRKMEEIAWKKEEVDLLTRWKPKFGFPTMEEKALSDTTTLPSAFPGMPIYDVVQHLNRRSGYELISTHGLTALQRGGVDSLFRLRTLKDEKWQELPFSSEQRSVIEDFVGPETDRAFNFLYDYRFDRPNPRLVSNTMNSTHSSNTDLVNAAVFPFSLQKKIDREKVFSFHDNFRESVQVVCRPHAQKMKPHLKRDFPDFVANEDAPRDYSWKVKARFQKPPAAQESAES